ncbi:MAG: hypothetical protein KBD16_00190 [Candidatus Pacebacteria bacterium]|nr:hypothetical protein [Candidatus Paceibacterota bacterium]
MVQYGLPWIITIPAAFLGAGVAWLTHDLGEVRRGLAQAWRQAARERTPFEKKRRFARIMALMWTVPAVLCLMILASPLTALCAFVGGLLWTDEINEPLILMPVLMVLVIHWLLFYENLRRYPLGRYPRQSWRRARHVVLTLNLFTLLFRLAMFCGRKISKAFAYLVKNPRAVLVPLEKILVGIWMGAGKFGEFLAGCAKFVKVFFRYVQGDKRRLIFFDTLAGLLAAAVIGHAAGGNLVLYALVGLALGPVLGELHFQLAEKSRVDQVKV